MGASFARGGVLREEGRDGACGICRSRGGTGQELCRQIVGNDVHVMKPPEIVDGCGPVHPPLTSVSTVCS